MVHNKLRKIGVFISGSDVRSNKHHHDPDNFKKYLTTLVTKVAVDDLILNNEKVVALEKTAHTDEAYGEIAAVSPVYLGSQDTHYVGNFKGVGHINKQPFIDP
jgi:hypothetical protein